MAINSTSFTNTPQASDDEWYYEEDDLIGLLNTTETGRSYITFDVMSDDLGGKAKQLFSVSDEAGNLLDTYDALKSADGLTNGISAWEETTDGNYIRINNGKIDFDISAEKIQSLADGEAYQDTFIYAIRLGNGTLSWATVTINITGENDAPTDIALSSNSVLENADGAIIGALTTTDVDNGDTHTYTVSDARFEVVDGNLKLKAGESLDFENEPTVTITVTTTDNHNASFSEDFVINVGNLDEVAPTITSGATAAAIDENSGAAQVVYTVTADDSADISAGVSFSLKAVDDFAAFSIDPDTGEVTLSGDPDFEAQSSYSFTVLADDGVNTPTEQAVTLAINDVNEGPVVASPYTGTGDANDFDSLLGTATSSFTLVNGTAGDDIIAPAGPGPADSDTSVNDKDIINGLGGNDTINAGEATDQVYGGDGADTINGGAQSDSLYGQAGSDTIHGDAQGDNVYGGSGNDILFGDVNNDIIYGGSGSDTIDGGANTDTIIGGYGADTLTGGSGTDTFQFLSVLDTGDVITGFLAVDDTLDFSAIDANSGTGANDAFAAATNTATVSANSINYFQDGGGNTVVWADTDGNTSTVEFQMTLTSVTASTLTSSDFVL